MRTALALVWAAPEHEGPDGPEGSEEEKKGNGQPAPSTVLVVEDEVLVRLTVADYLRRCGYRVLEAKTAEEAQAILRAGELVEVLFSDIDLGPGLNGVALAQWARETYRDIRIVLTSGKMTEAAADLCDRPLMRKPYAYDRLAEEIKALLGALGRRGGG